MPSNTTRLVAKLLEQHKQYKMEPALPVTQKPILETSWEDVKNSCNKREPSTKRSK